MRGLGCWVFTIEQAMTHHSSSNDSGAICLEQPGHLTSSLSEARQIHEKRGGYLFRMAGVFLICSYEEALKWGWRPAELKHLRCRPAPSEPRKAVTRPADTRVRNA